MWEVIGPNSLLILYYRRPFYLPCTISFALGTQTCCTKFNSIQKYWGDMFVFQKCRSQEIWPRWPNRGLWWMWKGGEGHPFLQYPHKASIWVPNTMCKYAAPKSTASESTGDMFVFQKSKGQKSGNLIQKAQSRLAMVIKRRRRPLLYKIMIIW